MAVLMGGRPASGTTTLARALASELVLPFLSKDDVKEALMDARGTPRDVDESRVLGRAAVFAVIDSTWFDYTEAPRSRRSQRPPAAPLPCPPRPAPRRRRRR